MTAGFEIRTCEMLGRIMVGWNRIPPRGIFFMVVFVGVGIVVGVWMK